MIQKHLDYGRFIPGFNYYSVNKYGVVWSWKNCTGHRPYYLQSPNGMVNLRADDGSHGQSFRVEDLIQMAFKKETT